MTEISRLQRETLNYMLGTACTTNVVDRQKQLAAFYYARAKGIESECKRIFLEKRFAWIDWITVTQRKWQCGTRNPNKAVHHDSIELREKYVRC